MKRSDPRFRVGLALTLGGFLLFAFVFSLDGALTWVQGSATVQVRFPNAQGLMLQDPVHFHGVPCGRVSDLQFDTDFPSARNVAHADDGDATDDVSVLLTLEVPPKVRSYLREGTEATIKKTLTGVTVVNLDQGEGPPLADGTILEGTPEATISDVAGSMKEAITSMNRLMEGLEPVIDEFREEKVFSVTLERFGLAADEIRELAEQMSHTVNDLEDPIVDLAERTQDLVSEIQRSAVEIPDTISDLRGTVHGARDFVDDMRRFVHNSSPHWSAASEDIAATTSSARNLAEELRRRPWRLLKAPNSSDAAAIDLYETAARYADGALEVRRSLEVVRSSLDRRSANTSAHRELEQALEHLEQSLARQQSMERMFWERMAGDGAASFPAPESNDGQNASGEIPAGSPRPSSSDSIED